MHLIEGQLVVSPTDLTAYLACEHLTQLELAVARGFLVRPERADPELEVLRRRGYQHEEHYLHRLRSQGLRIAEVQLDAASLDGLRKAEAQTVEALRRGVDVVYQGTFFDGRWRCHADFLLRVAKASTLGDYSYEVADTKLATKVKASALLQMCAYSEQLERVQGGVPPDHMRAVLGGMKEEMYRLRDYAAYYRSVKSRFESRVFGAPVATYPDPVEHCRICGWLEVCMRRRRADDHLSLVASMRRDQIRRLSDAEVATVAALGGLSGGEAVKGIGPPALERLRQQARLQVRQRETGQTHYELLEPQGPGLGFSALPTPSPGDLFFDMEGDPLAGDGGLEYLFGVVEVVGGAPRGQVFWAHDRSEEKRAFEAVIDFLVDRLQRDPNLHIYHFASYEPTALKRLMGTHATREAEVDRLLRGGALVDLYQIVRQSVRVSQESYSLKQLETLFREPRATRIADAAASMVAYEQWLESGDRSILDDIADYNYDDCISTWKLRDWLEARRIEAADRSGPIPRPEFMDPEPSEALAEAEGETAELASALLESVPKDREKRDQDQEARWLLAYLISWHRREAKSEWWEYFNRLRLTDEELREDSDSIAGLTYEGEVGRVKQSIIHRYRFDPAQEYKIAVGDQPHDPRTRAAAGTVWHLDGIEGVVDLKRAANSPVPHPASLIPASPIDTKVLRQGLIRFARQVIDHGIAGPGPYRACRDLLSFRPPRLPARRPGEPPSEAARRCAPGLQDSYLAVQGPPGSGKTYTGARMIVDLVQAGKRVGITANSHKVIGNLLDEVCKYAEERHVAVQALQKAEDHERCASQVVSSTDKNDEVDAALRADLIDIVAGTPWLFAREELVGRLDTLVVDEAGQMSLANVMAMSGAARNLVLLGDPNQLRQPSHRIHPPGVDSSALDHVIEGHMTLPPERGIFLNTTWRMHPDVCRFISEVFYEARLEPDPSCARQSLGARESSAGTGLRYLAVPHTGNRSASSEEAERVAVEFKRLRGRSWTDRLGRTRPLGVDDILVVAPYNAQVRRLIDHLPRGARVGTVDKFQGQEAPVVIYSMATSSAEDLPRNMDFLYSRNRLNVAVSRAQALAILVCSPELLKARCRTPDQIRMANALCRFAEICQ